ncbi:tyrosine-type recombinase/integrase [Sporosarcina sp. ACRSL]|uniref:tyrosine-type recombinase/integrase n=1 Tax=Sporosarcina sp. ACRSL TaxID=2918215 RepID=UPI001EF6D0FC|nr:tyrosine-type recombinase/integrase [Sporosarcina sp. ACRSL]MCG7345322.1 tyrosine-type recombinase/integrase [Sporosarcina sp. ACRSL]
MNEVQAIKDRRHIERIKQSLHGRDLLLFTLGINVGLRISDLLALTVGDLRDKDAVTITEGKTRKTRTFTLNGAAKDAISTLIPADASDSDYVFPSRKSCAAKGNKPISRVQAYRILNDAIARAGLDGVYTSFGAHSLRKTFGYFAYESGVDIALLMRVLNHSSQRETLRYIGIEAAEVANVYHAVNL